MTPAPNDDMAASQPAPAAGQRDDRYRRAIGRFDEANAQDPSREEAAGQSRPAALLYAERMSVRLAQFAPDASEALCLAVRAQHLERWKIARATYPEGRKGYHEWRTALGRFHAVRAGEILREAGYDEPFIGRVQSMLRKERLKLEPDAQALEDVACLVFLEFYFTGFGAQHEDDKVVDILRKTWRKMSPRGQQAALTLPLSPAALSLVQRATKA